MKREPSILAGLVIAYHERFGRHVPEPALRQADAGNLAEMLEDSLATGEPLSEGNWGYAPPTEFNPRGCIRDEKTERETRTKGPDGEWLQ